MPLKERQKGRGATLDSFLQFDAVLKGAAITKSSIMAERMEICLQGILVLWAKTAETLEIAPPTHVLSDTMVQRSTEWEAMRHACDIALIDVVDSNAVSAKEILCGILGRKEVWSEEKSESQRQLESLCYAKIRLEPVGAKRTRIF
jgi:hypothetical protein